MSDKNKVISTKITEGSFARLETYATTHNISIAALVKLFINAILNGEIEVEKGELKYMVDPIGYAVSEDFGAKIDRRFDKLRERGYPEKIIESMKEQILAGLDSQIDLLPRRYDPRRMRDNDCGC